MPGLHFLPLVLSLLLQFRYAGRALLVLSTLSLSLLGDLLSLLLASKLLGVTILLGVNSLLGIPVHNGVIPVSYADELVRDHGYCVKDAVFAAVQRQISPIFLPSPAAMGVILMLLRKSPLSSVSGFGIMVAMAIALFVVPVLYYQSRKGQPPRASLMSITSPRWVRRGHQHLYQ